MNNSTISFVCGLFCSAVFLLTYSNDNYISCYIPKYGVTIPDVIAKNLNTKQIEELGDTILIKRETVKGNTQDWEVSLNRRIKKDTIIHFDDFNSIEYLITIKK